MIYYNVLGRGRDGFLMFLATPEVLQALLLLDAFLDSLAHLLDGLELGEAETALVGDVVHAANGLGVLAVDASGLDVELVAELLELGHGAQVAALLHGDDAEVVLLVHPDEEGLVLVVEDTAAVGPVVVAGRGAEEPVGVVEEEVILGE